MVKGVAGIVAAILLIVILAAAIVLMISVQRQLTQAQESAARISLERQQLSLALEKSIFSYMVVYTNLSKATLILRNAFTQPVLVQNPLVVYTVLNYSFAQPLGTGYTTVLYNESLIECPASTLPVTNVSRVELDPGCTLYVNFTYTLEPATLTSIVYAGPSTLAAAATITAKKLYPGETAAAGVTATATTTTPTTTTATAGPTLTLYYRSAVIADNFSSNPFTSGRLLIVSGGTNWTWVPTGYIIYDNATTEGLLNGSDEAAVLFNTTTYAQFLGGFLNETIPTSKTIYILAKVTVNAWNVTYKSSGFFFNRFYNETGEADVLTTNSTLSQEFVVYGLYRDLYISAYNTFFQQVTTNFTGQTVWNYNGTAYILINYSAVTSVLNDSIGVPLLYDINITYSSAAGGYEYVFSLENASTGALINYTSGVVPGSALSNITFLGLGTWYANVSFDDVLVTVGGNPFFINVTGLPGSGWNVTLIEYSGTTPVYVVSGVSDAAGNVALNLSSPSLNSLGQVEYMFCNAEMRVYTPTGLLNLTLSSSSVPGGCFLGGDVYRYG